MSYSMLVPLLRHGLQALGGWLAATGYLDESMTEAFVGFGLNAVALAWYLAERWWNRK